MWIGEIQFVNIDPVKKNYKELEALYNATFVQLTNPSRTQFIDTSFGQTHLVSSGSREAKPVLVLHGAASNAVGCWPLINGLASKYCVHAPDAPRQLGKTETFHLSSANQDYGKWLAEVLDKLEIERVRVVGFSFGGWMACKLALFVPKRIEKLVLISPIGIAPFRIRYLLQAPVSMLWMLISRSDASVHRFTKLVAGQTASNELIDEMATSARVFLKNFHFQDIPYRFSRKNLQKISTPTYLLAGKYDPFCNPEVTVSQIQNNLPNSQTEVIPDAGHVLIFEKPELVNARVIKFFE